MLILQPPPSLDRISDIYRQKVLQPGMGTQVCNSSTQLALAGGL